MGDGGVGVSGSYQLLTEGESLDSKRASVRMGNVKLGWKVQREMVGRCDIRIGLLV